MQGVLCVNSCPVFIRVLRVAEFTLFSCGVIVMKFSVISAGVVLGLALSGAVVAAESTDDDATSGASDSTVMTQTQDTKAAQAAQKQKTETTKGGRPQNATPQKQSN
ncbi:hypothetical protein ALO36_100786 [Pseudomonas syringae pv. tomato]|nr:hypothetical protein ALO36_100786 [Pseudomonas syringae pv. tomato]RMR19553.1 hypothetical protein ALP89_100407 [Pseudomonas syringae pv. persicae]RMU02687.1 hypothetical protein ALP36_100455 [Pseudomonas syringae pv. coriandricola]